MEPQTLKEKESDGENDEYKIIERSPKGRFSRVTFK
jgi:hypothetical protein